MPHSFNKLWIHAVWATKDRYPLITDNHEEQIHNYICNQLVELNCMVRIINGMPDHVHCLFMLNPNKSIAEVIKQVKGGSSHTINDQNIMPEKFAWQTGYGAFSVSESQLDKVYQYILNQKQHHTQKTFSQEYDEFMKAYGFSE